MLIVIQSFDFKKINQLKILFLEKKLKFTSKKEFLSEGVTFFTISQKKRSLIVRCFVALALFELTITFLKEENIYFASE